MILHTCLPEYAYLLYHFVHEAPVITFLVLCFTITILAFTYMHSSSNKITFFIQELCLFLGILWALSLSEMQTFHN